MYAQVEKKKENKGRATANSITKKEHRVKQKFNVANNCLVSKNQNLLQCKEISNSKIIQLTCEKCGSNKHKTSKCPMTKQQIDQHKEEIRVFKEAKRRTLAEMPKGATTSAFSSKHIVSSGTTVANASKRVANTRTWGGGGQAGTSTVIKMSAEDQEKEARFIIEGLKGTECAVVDGKIVPNMGVNKPTRHVYTTKSAAVTSDRQGKRTVREKKEKLGYPVLGLRGDKIHHLQGVDENL